MRLPSTGNILRNFYTLSKATSRLTTPSPFALAPFSASPRYITANSPMPSFFSSIFSTSSPSRKMPYKVQKSDQEWQAQLSPEQFRVLRKQGTEAPYSGEYDKDAPEAGTYACAACNSPLYTAQHKFQSGCGWPAFFDAIPGKIDRHEDSTMGMARTEIVCHNCGGHLGHVFKGEKLGTPTDERHCVNSVSLKFDEKVFVQEEAESKK